MAKAYSQDLRERVIMAVGRGASRRAAAAQFSISASSAIKWDQRFRETGSALAKSLKGKSRSPLEAYAAWLLALNAEEPDLTLEEIRGRIEQEHAITPASKSGLTSLRRALIGRPLNRRWILRRLSSSTKRERRPIWDGCAAAARAASGSSAICRTDIGKQRPSSQACATAPSPLPS